MKKRLTSNGYMKDTQVIPGYDDDKNSVRAETEDITLTKGIKPIPHLEDPRSIKERLRKKPKPELI